MNIDEGTRQDNGGRRWDVEVISAGEAYAQRARAQEESAEERKALSEESKHDRDKDSVLKAFDFYPDGETKNTLREAAGMSGQRFGPALAELIRLRLVEECEIVKSNGQKYAGFRRTRTHSDTVGQTSRPSDLFGSRTHSDSPGVRL